MPDNTLSTLSEIKKLVRFYTNNLSTNQLSEADIETAINTFVLYDFPLSVQLTDTKKTLTFYTQPYVDYYPSNTINDEDPLYNLSNNFIYFEPNAWVNNVPMFYTQQPVQMNSIYPDVISTQNLSTGDGVTLNYTGTISGVGTATNNAKLLRGSVIFSSLDNLNDTVVCIDVPNTDPITGYYLDDGILVEPNFPTVSRGTINYLTGAYDVTFNAAPAAGQTIYLQTVKCQPSKPYYIMYFNNAFRIRPIPDKAYRIDIIGQQRPTELINNNSPEIAAWFQYIAAGAAKKIYQMQTDPTGVQTMDVLMDEQKNLIMAKTIKILNNNPPQSLLNNNLTRQAPFTPWR